MIVEEKISFKNKKGLILSGILHTPKNTQRKKLPTVLILHGFTGYKEETHIVKLAEELEKNGFCALRFDASGSNESEGTFEKDYRFENYLEDALCAIKKLKEFGFVDAKNIFVWGHSMGGQLAFWVAHKDKSVKALCAVSCPQLLGKGDVLEAFLPQIESSGYYERNTKIFGNIKIPYAFFKNRDEFYLNKILKVIKQPKLIIWGTKDDIVAPKETEEVAMLAAMPKEKFVVEGMGHNYKKYPELLEKVNEKIIEFFSKWAKKQ